VGAGRALAKTNEVTFIRDGYPGTLGQAGWLSDCVWRDGDLLRHGLVSIDLAEELIVDRLSRRRIHAQTQAVYHLDFNPPPPDVPAHLIIQRPDDQPEAIVQRLRIYRNQTAPVEAYYDQLGLLRQVDGVGSREAIYQRILDALHVPA